jgi:hypothetical protein
MAAPCSRDEPAAKFRLPRATPTVFSASNHQETGAQRFAVSRNPQFRRKRLQFPVRAPH